MGGHSGGGGRGGRGGGASGASGGSISTGDTVSYSLGAGGPYTTFDDRPVSSMEGTVWRTYEQKGIENGKVVTQKWATVDLKEPVYKPDGSMIESVSAEVSAFKKVGR